MSSGRNGPQSTIVTAPGFFVGCIFDKEVESLSAKYGAAYSQNTAVPRSPAMSEMSWNIYAGDLVAYVNQNYVKNNAGRGPPGGYKGRTPVVAQVASMPFQTTQSRIVAASEDEVVEVKNQKLLEKLTFVGVSQTAYHNEAGQDHTPVTNGIQVLVWGPSTVKVPMAKPIPPMTDIVLAIDPSAGTSPYNRVQSLNTAERTPLTIKPFEPRGPVHAARQAVASYIDKYAQSGSGNNTFNPYGIHKSNRNGSSLYSENDTNGAAFTVAALSIGLGFVETLIRNNYLQYNAAATAGHGGEANAKQWRAGMPAVLGIPDASKGENKKLVEQIVRNVLLGELPDKTTTDDTTFRSLSKSAMALLASSMGDIQNQQFRIIGKNIQQHIGKDPRLPTGYVETDVIWQ